MNHHSVLHLALTFDLDENMLGDPLYGQLIQFQIFLKNL